VRWRWRKNAPDEHARFRGGPLREPGEVALERSDEHVALRTVERAYAGRVRAEAVVSPCGEHAVRERLR
jgi:hypothetical protein